MKLILVDSREPAHVAQSIKRGHPLLPTEVKKLQAGDIWIMADEQFIIIERKTVPDLLASIKDGRLENQVMDALKLTRNVVVLIEGEWSTNDDGFVTYDTSEPFPSTNVTGWKSASVWGALSKVQRMGGIIRMYQRDLVAELTNIYRMYEKHMTVLRRAEVQAQCPEAAFLACLPGIGADRAAAIWTTHGNLASALSYLTTPDDDAWPSIPGIGKKTRENIHDFIGAMLLPVNKFNEEIN